MKRNPSSLLTGINNSGRSVFEQEACGFKVAGGGGGVQRHNLHRIRGHRVDRRSTFDQQTDGSGLPEKTGEVQGGEAVSCMGVDSEKIVVKAQYEAIETRL